MRFQQKIIIGHILCKASLNYLIDFIELKFVYVQELNEFNIKGMFDLLKNKRLDWKKFVVPCLI
jgi:hypothetical protein